MTGIITGEDPHNTPPAWVDPLDPGAPHSGTDPGVPGNGSGVRQWALGIWWAGNYPACVHFYEDRLCFAGAPQSPDRIDMSNSTAYEVFSPNALLDGTVVASNACAFSLNSNTVNAVRWLQSDQNGLIAGTAGGEWIVSSASITEALSPTSIIAKQTTEFGAAQVPPVHTGMTTLFLQAGGRKLRELKYSFMINGFEGTEISPLAEHLTAGSFSAMALQRTPQQVLWLVRNDGTLVSVSYDSDQNEVAWASHPVGGGSAKVLSLAVIPSPDGDRDEVWLAVQHDVGGQVVFIERMSKMWEVGDATLDTTVAPDFYRYVPSLTTYLDASQRLTSNTAFSSVSGLTWLEGVTVGVLADGAAHPDCVVDGTGTIQLARPANDVVVGINYTSIGRTLTIEAGGADGPAQGKIKRIHRVIFRVYESAGFQCRATNSTAVNDVVVRQTNDVMDEPVPLQTDDIPQQWEGTYDRLGQVEWQQSQPLPLNLAGLVVQLETQDGG